MPRSTLSRRGSSAPGLMAGVVLLGTAVSPAVARAQMCTRTITADVVALDQPFFWNRLGASQPQGMIFALDRDIVNKADLLHHNLSPGNVMLRPDKRPRPLVLRVNVGDCLKVNFTNLLANAPVDPEQPATRTASVHVVGMQLVGGIASDGSNVGANQSSLVESGNSATYTFYAEREGTYLLYSTAANTGGEGDMGSLAAGLFGAVNVEPRGSEWYRSQVTRAEMDLATVGITPNNQPVLDYDAVYPAGHAFAGLPILKILDDLEVVHSDLTAIITGQGRGFIADGMTWSQCADKWTTSGGAWGYANNHNVLRNRCEPFREFTIIFHDEPGALQAFPAFTDPVLSHTLHSVRDGFAINYGTGGIGAEILANRLGLGPMKDCVDCKYEEFFLTSWAVGDPAMVVDIPANASNPAAVPPLVATKALYPDDPSNVYHSYLSDHVKIRNLHAGKEHHIFHLHAHQWLFTPDSPGSSYLDSQAIGPGASYTYEITYDGSGNRNKTPGDAIFHCHFYPHFAQGMWSLWRIHDVFEQGTMLGVTGAPASGARALPDGEIVAGTPIPGLVPLPGLPMAPMPTPAMQGYPFYIPGVAGHRPPHPPLDLAPDAVNGGYLDGGLPRHVVIAGTASMPPLNRLDFDKVSETLNVMALPETGVASCDGPLSTRLCSPETTAMAYHEARFHDTFIQPTNGTNPQPGRFRTNGAPRIAGAPFADPCIDDSGLPIGLIAGRAARVYKAAGFQIDARYSRSGWHFPQHRMLALNEDVGPTMDGTRAPEPFYFRANSGDCIEFHHSNLLPHVYQLDDFQVKTPTDVLGQHIHLVKFDVTASDGSGNGFNYEDGTFAPGEVRERLHAIQAFQGCDAGGTSTQCAWQPKLHPDFADLGDLALGAQTTIQRWWADPVLNNSGQDRTLRTVYTHDHYAPSTQQQAGYYAGLVIEPTGSTWRHNETGVAMYTRPDGGPTSWQAIIETPDKADSYREFLLSQADFGLGYTRDAVFQSEIPVTAADGTPHVVHGAFVDRAAAINPPGRVEIGLPFLTQRAPFCPSLDPLIQVPPPCPEAISADDPGFMSLNYRTEPLALRVRDPVTNMQATNPDIRGDLSHAFRSDLGVDALGMPVLRADPDMNQQPVFYPPLTADVRPGDPFTPIMRAYENDRVQMRLLVGAQEEGHNFLAHGLKWLLEPSWSNSGYRNFGMMGISEHFEMAVPEFPPIETGTIDYLVLPGAAVDDIWGGMWTMLRTYDGGNGLRGDLAPVPSNPKGDAPRFRNPRDWKGVCPASTLAKGSTQDRQYRIVAGLARDLLPGGTLTYNSRAGLHDPTAILYVFKSDLDRRGRLKSGVPIEPLVLRANAGDCIRVELENRLPAVMPDLAGFSALPMVVDFFNANQVVPSGHVGLSPQLVANDIAEGAGVNVGFNPVRTAAPGQVIDYKWYAGEVLICQGSSDPRAECANRSGGWRAERPVEYGATPLISSDRIKHAGKGAIGTLIIEPMGSTWTTDYDAGNCGKAAQPRCSRAAATVVTPNGTFREFALNFQDDVNLRRGGGNGTAVPNLAEAEDAEDTGQKAFNYRTEPMWARMGFDPDEPLTITRTRDFTNALSNAAVGGTDPQTPVFIAAAGQAVRFRVVQSGGHARNHVFNLHGHIWDQLPFQGDSRWIGWNEWSEWKGTQEGIGVGSAYNFMLHNGAGGKWKVTGDYLFRDFEPFMFDGGLWGILRVTCPAGTTCNVSPQ